MTENWNHVIERAHPVSNGETGPDLKALKEAVAPFGFRGAVGLGVVNADGEPVASSWRSFAVQVVQGEVWGVRVSTEPKTRRPAPALETAFLHPGADSYPYPTRGLIPGVDAILDRRAEEAAEDAHVVYFYTTRTPTIPLSALTEVTTVIQDEATAETEGPCQSGAAINCEGRGFLRVLPESMLGGRPEQIIQCVPCHEASAAAYARKVHHYGDTEA